MEGEIGLDTFKKLVPKNRKNLITQAFMDNLNGIMTDVTMREAFRDNIIGYVDCLQAGRFKVDQYIKAVQYCTHKMANCTNIDAYIKTFPDRYQDMINRGKDDNHLSSVIGLYNAGKMVQDILGRTMTPVHIMNKDIHQKAINKLQQLMIFSNNERIQMESAGKLVEILKPPETQKLELDIGIKNDPAIEELKRATAALVKGQREAIEFGASSAESIANSKLVLDGEFEEVDE